CFAPIVSFTVSCDQLDDESFAHPKRVQKLVKKFGFDGSARYLPHPPVNFLKSR
ncbi:hypothetical protein MKW92_021083, partial [Papaver armeniacum]